MRAPRREVPAIDRRLARRDLTLYLDQLAGLEPADSLLEVRFRRAGSTAMHQRFYELRRRGQLGAHVLALAGECDVYIGCAPRRERFGGKRAIERVWVLWVDCDSAEALRRLTDFEPRPAMVVRSGTGKNCHAYWPLREPLAAVEAEHANRRLAHALNADMAATDAARILRPPATLNHKRRPAVPVTLEKVRFEPLRDALSIVGALPEPPDRPLPLDCTGGKTSANDDPLRRISPAVYVPALTEERLSHGRKVSCPLHRDRTPSLHAYETPDEGWYCFGCGRGGSIYDLAAAVWSLQTRGEDFLQLRQRLADTLSLEARRSESSR